MFVYFVNFLLNFIHDLLQAILRSYCFYLTTAILAIARLESTVMSTCLFVFLCQQLASPCSPVYEDIKDPHVNNYNV